MEGCGGLWIAMDSDGCLWMLVEAFEGLWRAKPGLLITALIIFLRVLQIFVWIGKPFRMLSDVSGVF